MFDRRKSTGFTFFIHRNFITYFDPPNHILKFWKLVVKETPLYIPYKAVEIFVQFACVIFNV